MTELNNLIKETQEKTTLIENGKIVISMHCIVIFCVFWIIPAVLTKKADLSITNIWPAIWRLSVK